MGSHFLLMSLYISLSFPVSPYLLSLSPCLCPSLPFCLCLSLCLSKILSLWNVKWKRSDSRRQIITCVQKKDKKDPHWLLLWILIVSDINPNFHDSRKRLVSSNWKHDESRAISVREVCFHTATSSSSQEDYSVSFLIRVRRYPQW